MGFKKSPNKSLIFISWQPYCSRSDNIAREFNGTSYKIYYDKFGSKYSTILFKYGLQFLQTIRILFQCSPEIVFVMSPPVFACIPVFLYCWIFKRKYIIDAHTGAFDNPMWRNVKFLQRFFCRRATLTTVTNEGIAMELRQWGCRYIIVPDVPIVVNKINKPEFSNSLNITLVNTFSQDEPLENFIEAAIKFNKINFFITGKIGQNNDVRSRTNGRNIKFTDYLPDADYYGYLKESDVVVVLTTRDNTMQRGAYEAIYLDTPVITSDWSVLRENFNIGAIFVDNTIPGIEEGINQAVNRIDELRNQVIILKKLKIERWRKNFEKINFATSFCGSIPKR